MTQILWLRNDLRLHDHQGFRLVQESGEPLTVVYILPETWLKKDAHNMTRLAQAKANFLRTTLQDLQQQLNQQSINFHLYSGDSVSIFTRLFDQLKGNDIHLLTSHPQAPEERDEINAIRAIKPSHLNSQFQFTTYNSQTLFSTTQCRDLLNNFPATFTAFRKLVENNPEHWQVAADIKTPSLALNKSILPIQSSLDWPENNVYSSQIFKGGEQSGQQWLAKYLWQQRAIAHYKTTRNDLTDQPAIRSSSSHLSAYLAWDCLSPRYVWHEILNYEAEYGRDEHTYWLRFELLWREYFHWSLRSSLTNPAHNFGAALFSLAGIQQNHSTVEPQVTRSNNLWQHWCEATTGVPMVDAGLRELQQTGFLSNRLRQNMASYFIHQLQLDWRLGARWFEMHLIDYDVASNYGNWAYIAGVGHDARPQRQFNLNKQLQQYDPELTHIRLWCPELMDYDLDEILQHQAGKEILTTYPAPVVAVLSGEN